MAKISHQELRHKHVIVRAEVENPPLDVQTTTEWFRVLIEKLGMEIMMGPFVEYHEQEGNRGLTGVSVITTSHIALHCWDEPTPAVIQFDIYSCSDIHLPIVWEALSVYKPIKIEYKFIDRETDLRDISSGSVEYKLSRTY
jgi:S-adenosylmethionine/arginine decarboxylase-like enzyme